MILAILVLLAVTFFWPLLGFLVIAWVFDAV